jgi:hypothetical protein
MSMIRFPWLLEPAPSGIGLFRQIEKHLHDAGIFVYRRIEKKPVINETLYRGDGSALLSTVCARRPRALAWSCHIRIRLARL